MLVCRAEKVHIRTRGSGHRPVTSRLTRGDAKKRIGISISDSVHLRMLRHDAFITKYIRESSFANKRLVHCLGRNIPTRGIATLTIRRIKLMSELTLRFLKTPLLPVLF